MSINVNDKNLGHATAYAYYKAGGGTMTEAEFTEFMADFGTASQTAVEAAQAALASKNAAQTAATTATNKASEATTAATTATTKAGEASTSASTATSAKDTAVSASQTATTKATEATTAAATATSAKTDAVAANTAAQSAKTAAQTAQTGAETAAASVSASAAQIATNTDDIAQLKSDLSDIVNVSVSSNRLDLEAMTPNTYIATDGASTASPNYSVTDFIPVTEGETVNCWCKRSDSYYLFDSRFLCAYDTNKVAVPASGQSFTTGTYTVPEGIAYIRLSISNTYLSTYTNFYVGSLTLSEADQYEPYGTTTELKAQGQIDQNTSIIADISERTSNLFDPSAITPQVYITTDGAINAVATLSATDYLPVISGTTIYGWGKNNGSYTQITYRFVCAYDANKTPIPASGISTESTGAYDVPDGVAYVRITLRNEVLSYEDLYIGTHQVGINYESYGYRPKGQDKQTAHTIHNGDSILEGVKYCYDNGIENLIVQAGTYDVIAEYEDFYGSDYFDNYTDYSHGDFFDAGIWLQNINVKFSAGAKVVCHYTGNNANVPLYFSAFATGNNVTIDGLVLDAENLRYGIHADYNSGADETFFYVRNCDLKHYKNATSMQAIGAGLGSHVFWLFENTIFRSAGGNDKVLRIHNNVNSDAQSKIIVKDCYIDGDGYFKFNAYSTSELQTIIQVCGCSFKTAPVVDKETSESNENFTMIAWNNEIRSA